MNTDLEVDELVALLLDEHRYEGSLSPKAVHKILYFADRELDRERVSVELPTFWYMYGAMVATSGTRVDTGGEVRVGAVTCDVATDDIDASDGTIRRGREALSRALDRYYDLGLDGLTDEMYREAPYDVQRHYRRLDKQLGVAADDGQMTLFGAKNEEQTRETLYDFVESFPVDDFPAYEDDLHIWYRLMSAELDADDYDPARGQRLAQTFWRLFCLELACRENNGLSREEIADELNVRGVEAVKRQLRERLRTWEREKARTNALTNEKAIKAAEALVVPYLDFEVTT